jgi:hypothetical protein
MKKKLLLLETEMKGPGGHYLDNLIESFFFFKDDFQIYSLLNKSFDSRGTYVPDELEVLKLLNRNNFEKKNNKLLHYIFETLSFFKRLFLGIILVPFFLYKKNFVNYFNALISNRFILPRYFSEIYFFLKENNFSSEDHILFQTTRNKHMSLANFIIRLKLDIPKIHLRILYTPSYNKLGGFNFFLNKIKPFLKKKKVFIYVLTKKNYEILTNQLNFNEGIFMSNIPWVFFSRSINNLSKTIGYMGDARVNRGFNLLPELIEKLTAISSDFKFIIQYAKTDKTVIATSDKLHEMAKLNSNINICQKYLDYKEFRDTLKKIDIMPILHNSNEINLGNPSTIYSSITHEIPMTVPSNLKYMKDVLIHQSYEESNNIDETVKKILLIKNNYTNYLESAKKNSSILAAKFFNDPLKINIS